MRAALLLSTSLLLACGGRTLPDSVYDDGAVAGSGGSGAGGSSRAGAPSIGPGGGAPRGGSPSVGGAPSISGAPAGGAFSKGGAWSGGAPSDVRGECKSFCVGFDRVCPGSYDFDDCFSSCTSAGRTNRCGELVRDAYRCFNEVTLSVPPGACGIAQQLVAIACRAEIGALGSCGFRFSPAGEDCQEKAFADLDSCQETLLCPGMPSVRELVCKPEDSAKRGSTCVCMHDGVILFYVESPSRGEQACAKSRDACFAANAF